MRIFIVLREKLPELPRDSSRLLGESHSRSNKLQTRGRERKKEIKRILGEFDSLLIYPLFESSFPDPIPSDEQKIGIKINLIF